MQAVNHQTLNLKHVYYSHENPYMISCECNRSFPPYNRSLWETWLSRGPTLSSVSWRFLTLTSALDAQAGHPQKFRAIWIHCHAQYNGNCPQTKSHHDMNEKHTQMHKLKYCPLLIVFLISPWVSASRPWCATAVYTTHPGLPPGPWRGHQCGPNAADARTAVPMPARTRNNGDFPQIKLYHKTNWKNIHKCTN